MPCLYLCLLVCLFTLHDYSFICSSCLKMKQTYIFHDVRGQPWLFWWHSLAIAMYEELLFSSENIICLARLPQLVALSTNVILELSIAWVMVSCAYFRLEIYYGNNSSARFVRSFVVFVRLWSIAAGFTLALGLSYIIHLGYELILVELQFTPIKIWHFKGFLHFPYPLRLTIWPD